MGRKTVENCRNICLQLRINNEEKELLNTISKRLNLSFREVFTFALEIMSLTIEKIPTSENIEK